MTRLFRSALMAALLLAPAALNGCALASYTLDVFGGDKEVKVDAEYQNLQNRAVAVIVHADPETLYRHPDARLLVARSVAARLADNVPGIQIMDPRQVEAFQRENPHWTPYTDLQRRLGVERLVVVDLIDYSLHDPENAHTWRGLLSANVGVTEGDAANAEAFAYTNTVRVRYPDQPVPLLGSDEATIQLGLLDRFSTRTAGLFHTHKEVR